MKKIFLLATIFTFCFSALQAQKIYSTKSGRITFFSKSPLENIEAKNSEVESKLSANGQVIFMLLIKGFHFPNALMEEHFNENYMESSKLPKSDFKGVITNIKDINFTKDGTYPAKATGKLTIHGITHDVETTGNITVKEGKVSSNSSFSIHLKDYGIQGGAIGNKVAENITISVDCQYE